MQFYFTENKIYYLEKNRWIVTEKKSYYLETLKNIYGILRKDSSRFYVTKKMAENYFYFKISSSRKAYISSFRTTANRLGKFGYNSTKGTEKRAAREWKARLARSSLVVKVATVKNWPRPSTGVRLGWLSTKIVALARRREWRLKRRIAGEEINCRASRGGREASELTGGKKRANAGLMEVI